MVVFTEKVPRIGARVSDGAIVPDLYRALAIMLERGRYTEPPTFTESESTNAPTD